MHLFPIKFSSLAILATIGILLGGHWGVLQSIAWVGMIYFYSESVGLREGISKTFDGKNPCRLCESLRDARTQESNTEILVGSVKKVELLRSSLAELPSRRDPRQSAFPAPGHESAPSFSAAPAEPVPLG